MNTNEEFLRSIPGIDYDAAVTNCGGEDLFLDTLKIYFETAAAKADDIERFAREGDLRNYTIRVHALKSASRLIGALALSADALHLEEAGNASDTDEINAKTPALLADFRSLYASLKPFFGETFDADKPEISADALRALYEKLRAAADEFDLDAMDSCIEEIKGFRLPDNERERFAQAKQFVTEADYAALTALLESGIKPKEAQ